MGDLMKATITLADDPIIKGNRVSIKATSGGTYSFFKTKQSDGTPTVAYQGMESMELKKGMTVNIAYDTTEGEYQGKKIQYKNIKTFQEPSIQVDDTPPLANTHSPVSRDYDRENWGKCKYGFLLEAYKLGKTLSVAEKESEDWADASMRKLEKEEEIDVSKIPF